MGVIELIFLLLALLIILYCFMPNFQPPPRFTVAALVQCLIGLLILYVVYLIVVRMFGGGPIL